MEVDGLPIVFTFILPQHLFLLIEQPCRHAVIPKFYNKHHLLANYQGCDLNAIACFHCHFVEINGSVEFCFIVENKLVCGLRKTKSDGERQTQKRHRQKIFEILPTVINVTYFPTITAVRYIAFIFM